MEIKKIISHAKEYGFIFPSSDIYEGLSAVYDYAHNGVELKNNIKNYWWKAMVDLHSNIVGIDSAIFMHPTTWEASGHVDAFNDPLIDNKDSKLRYRADSLVEEYCEKLDNKILKEISKAKKRFGKDFDQKKFIETNPKVSELKKKIEKILNRLNTSLEKSDLNDVRNLIIELEIVCKKSGTKNWSDVKQFNLMFSTKLGATSGSMTEIFLRPETAQGIFVNFLNVQKTSRLRVPFGIAQVGKAFRNEIIARQFIFRMKEFEQMEMQFFVPPGTQKEWYNKWMNKRMEWHKSIGMGSENYRFKNHEKLAHYADAACDIEFKFPFGFRELEGIHSRTDFDLSNHERFSGKNLKYFDPKLEKNYIPYVVETSIGLDRMFLAVLSWSLREDKLTDGTIRKVLKFPVFLAPIKLAVLPLVKKDGLPEYAKKIFDNLKLIYSTQYDEKDAIGRRYRRQDAIGTPFCITIDYTTLDDHTVTLRERDHMKQERIPLASLENILNEKLNVRNWLRVN